MKLPPLFNFPASSMDLGEYLVHRLSQIPGYRVLRELSFEGLVDQLSPRSTDMRIVAIVDTETTGLDPSTDRLVEIAIERLSVDARGQIIEMERPRSWREDPGRSMPPRLTQLTGLTDADLVGCAFDDRSIVAQLGEADVIIAHNASFDRPFVDVRFPALKHQAWGCSLTQLDWLFFGFDGRALGHLLFQAGWYFKGHRAEQDVHALATLLGGAAADGRTLISHLLEHCDRPNFRVAAVGDPFDAKDLLKGRGYRWDATHRYWWREIDADVLDEEKGWLSHAVYARNGGHPNVLKITASERFAR
jgi:DNA polymerase-3 subunit epsilon